MLLFSSGAAVAGPQILLNLRGISEKKFIGELLEKVSPEKFEAAFGVKAMPSDPCFYCRLI